MIRVRCAALQSFFKPTQSLLQLQDPLGHGNLGSGAPGGLVEVFFFIHVIVAEMPDFIKNPVAMLIKK